MFEPTFMLRDRRHKFFYSESEPPLLYDLEADPRELTDLADQPEQAQTVERFTQLGQATWDAGALKARIIDDQNRRRLIHEAQGIGRRPVWDFQPAVDASRQSVRAGKWTVEVEAQAHLDVQ